MAYASPTLTASGATFAQLQTRGLSGMVDAAIAANAAFPRRALAHMATAKGGRLQDTYDAAAAAVSNYLRGEPMAAAEVNAHLLDLAAALKAVLQAVEESAALIVLNPGTIGPVAAGPGRSEARRTFP